MASFANYLGSRLGLLGYWRHDETTGTAAANKVLTGVAGTYTGSPTLGSAGFLADGNKAVRLNGSSQYITMGSSVALRPTAKVAVAALFQPDVVNVARQNIAGVGSPTAGYLLCLENATLKFYVNGVAASVAGVVASATYFVLATFDGTTLRIFVSGFLLATQAIGGGGGGGDGITSLITLGVGPGAGITPLLLMGFATLGTPAEQPIDYTGVTNFVVGQRHGIAAGEYFDGTIDEIAVLSEPIDLREARILNDARANRGFQVNLHLEFSGPGNGWTDVTRDLMGGQDGQYGMPGSGVLDRIARTGELNFGLNNSSSNSAGLMGYYSPNHVNRRAGFQPGIRCRLIVGYGGGLTRTLHLGSLDAVVPPVGLYDSDLTTTCVSVDYIDELARSPVTGVAVQVDQRSDQIFSTLIATMVRQPEAIDVDMGLDTYQLALDNVQDESSMMLSVLHDLAMSELGLIYDEGGTLFFENRAHRALSTSNVDTFLDTSLVALEPNRARGHSINKVQVANHPRAVDAAATTNLYILQSVMQVAGGSGDVTLLAPYRDPDNPGERVGGKDMVPPVTGTDYKANSQADGLGTDLSAFVSITPNFGGNGARLTIANTGGVPFFIGGEQANTYLRCRGRMITDFGETILEAEDLPTQVQFGRNSVKVDQPYQSDLRVGAEVAHYVLNLYKDPLTQVPKAGFYCPNTDDVFATRLLARRISDRVGIQESVSGLSATTGYYLNAVEYTFDESGHLFIAWTLAPSDQNKYWLLEIAGASELGATTRLGFGLIVGHTDILHGDAHGDVAHGDSAHSDVTHVDVGHQDANVGHTDTAHDDVGHTDNHTDVTHDDVAHVDSHSDVGHSDIAHGDLAHADFHDDLDGPDFHDDFHDDVPHVDSHGDVAHGDTHNDTAHSDVSHADVHDDVAHTDIGHGDVPAGHQDTGHGDTAHTDVSHNDAVHSDSHSDSAHGDIN